MPQGAPQGFPQGGPPGGGFPMGGPGNGGGAFFLPPQIFAVVALVMLGIMAVAFYQIYKKAGYNGLLGLLMMVPVVNVVMMLWFAFTEWPVARQLREQKALASLHADVAVPPQATPAPVPVLATEGGAPPSPSV